jgi:hypothetical protein
MEVGLNMTSPIDEYRRCAEICHDKKCSIQANNRAVSKMYRIVDSATESGSKAVAELFQLLDDPLAAHWIAHQLLERASVPLRIERRCLKLIKESAKSSIGDQYWLRQYTERKRSTGDFAADMGA